MGQRGRKSAAELKAVPTTLKQRPAPPNILSTAEKRIWVAVCLDESVDFFTTSATKELLVLFCRHLATGHILSHEINKFERVRLKVADGVRAFNALLRARDQESRAACSLATKLRISNQARYTPKAAETAKKGNTNYKPWEAAPP